MKVLTDNQYYSQIANVIREQNGTNNTYKPPQMVSALKDLFYEEVVGVPPISFQGIGENLLDYRIYGASGGVGDLITDSTDENYNKYKVPIVVSGKNLFNGELLQGYYTDSTMSTLASQNSNYKTIKIYLKKGKYTLSSNINLLIVRFITSQVYQSNPAGSNLTKTFTFEIENDGYISLAFRNENNQTWDNSTNLQIEIGDTATTYEEYTSPTITTIYLDSPILENESISLSDTNTNIQTVRGTNILTVDTTVQPSKVYVKSRKESSHEAQIRQLYESVNAELTQYKAQYGELGGE